MYLSRTAIRDVVIAFSLFLLGISLQAVEPPSLAEREAFFENKIRPLLVEKCYACHSAEKNKTKGGLALDSQAAWLSGGEHGPALIPGKPDNSLLIKAVRYNDDELKMPPKKQGGKLSNKEIQLLEQWIRDGAVTPKPVAKSSKDASNWWAFQPIVRPSIPNTGGYPIDAFISAKYQSLGIKPLGPADKRTLLRRVTYDLIGLCPPTTDEVNAFLNDTSADAYGKVVESPACFTPLWRAMGPSLARRRSLCRLAR